MLKLGETGVLYGRNTHSLLLRHVGPGAIVSAFELRVKFLKALAIRSARKWIRTRLYRSHFEAADALQRIQCPTRGLAEFAVIHDINTCLSLPFHNLCNGFFQALLVRLYVCRGARFARAYALKEPRWPDDAAHMRGKDSVRAAFHSRPPYGLNSISRL